MADRRKVLPSRLSVLALAAILVAGAAMAREATAADGPALIAAHGFTPDQVGYVVYEAASGLRLAAHQAETPFLLASVAKVPTTVMALEVLGADHRFETMLVAAGTARNGTLAGDLYLIGGGDPLLEPSDLVGFVDALAARGITRVAGNYYYDESRLARREEIEPSQPEDAGYNPGVSALSLAFNRMRLRWQRPKGAGNLHAAVVAHSERLEVPLRNVSIETARRKAVGARRWQNFRYAGQDDGPLAGPRWLASRQLAKRGQAWLPVKRPGIFAARVLRSLAAARGIALPPPASGIAPGTVWVIHRHRSQPLAEIVLKVLKFSNNLTAELIGLSATLALSGRALDLTESGERTADWLRERLPATAWRDFVLANHSGLSAKSQASPAQLAAIMRFALDRSYGTRTYRELLPVEARRADQKKGAAILMRSKSGTIDYARSRVGVLRAKGGRELGFALFVADPGARRPDADDPDRRSPRARARARSWLRRARALEVALLRHWTEWFGAAAR